MADNRNKDMTKETKVARGADGRQMSALSYATTYRQKLKEEQVRRISEDKMRRHEEGRDARLAEREERRRAMMEQLAREREEVVARNAQADCVLADVKAEAPVSVKEVEQPVPTVEPTPVAEPVEEAPLAPAVEVTGTPAEPVAPSASDEIRIPAPTVVRRTAPAAPAAAAPKAEPVKVKVHTPPSAPDTTVSMDSVELQLVEDPTCEGAFTAVPVESDEDVVVITGEERSGIAVDGDDEDIVFLTDDASLPYEPQEEPEDEEDYELLIPDEESLVESIETEDGEEPILGEPVDALRSGKKKDRRAAREARRAQKKRSKKRRLSAEEKQAQRAAEAARIAEERERELAEARAERDALIRRLNEQKAAERAAADRLVAKDAAEQQKKKEEADLRLSAERERAEAERAANRAVFDAYEERVQKEERERAEAELLKAAEAEERREAQREEREAALRRIEEQYSAEELSEEQARFARMKRQLDAEAGRRSKEAAAKAERDSERDRAAAERAEDAALADRGIKDWKNDIRYAEPVEPVTEETVSVDAPAALTVEEEREPRRVEPRRVSYTRKELRAFANEADLRRQAMIDEETRLWNEEDRTEDEYAVLPEGVEDAKRRQIRALCKAELASLPRLSTACDKTLKLLKKQTKPTWLAARAGFEALVAEKNMIEGLVRAVKLARLGKMRSHVRPLTKRIAYEIGREKKLLKRQLGLTGYAPIPTDPTMPKALRKKKPFKIPTKLYRLKDDAE